MKTTRYTTKKCKCGTFTSQLVTPEVFDRAGRWDGSNQVGPVETRFVIYLGSHCLLCRGCMSLRYAYPVQGKFSAKHECSAKCLSSHGFVCECSCGGKNHGAAHG